MEAKNWKQAFKDAVDKGSSAEFAKLFCEYLKRFAAFEESFSPTPAEVDVVSAIFGAHCFYLKQTTDAQAAMLLEQGKAASKAFGACPIDERLAFLHLLKSKIDKYENDIILTITADTGKPIDLSAGEMRKGGEWFAFAAEQAAEQLKNTRPLGVAQVIGAYNYPYALAISGIVGALAAGNAVVVSAPLKAPCWVFPFVQAAREAMDEFGMKHLIQYSVGVNHALTVGADIVHFVGSDAAGDAIKRARGVKKVIREMGGSNMVVVMKSALSKMEPEDIAKTIYSGFGPATGQRCTAPRMLAVQKGAEEVAQLLEEVVARGAKDIGNPFMAGVKIGPLVDKHAHRRMREAIELAQEMGAKVYGTMQVKKGVPVSAESFWVNPVIIDWSRVDGTGSGASMRIHDCIRHEIFGPLLHILPPFPALDDAIRLVNTLDTHGLAGAIFTGSDGDEVTYRKNTHITAIVRNGPPKDLSPKAEHGHPGMPRIGGGHHFQRYADLRQKPR